MSTRGGGGERRREKGWGKKHRRRQIQQFGKEMRGWEVKGILAGAERRGREKRRRKRVTRNSVGRGLKEGMHWHFMVLI